MTETSRARRRTPIWLLAGIVTMAACAGENLFTGAATSAEEQGPDVEITTPTDGLTKAIGDSLLVEANVNAANGAATAVYSATYEVDDAPAYTSETEQLNGLSSVSLREFLLAAPDQTAGTAVVVVKVTDQAGEEGADTVSVTITN